MKLSIKFQDDPLNNDQHRQVMTAKVPTTIFSQPFVSGVAATTTNSASDFSFSLSTNFPSGPSLKLSYTPTATNAASLPFSLSVKSGLGISGSPRHSPLVFSAGFSFSPSSSVPFPTFFLHLKPQFGHFSLVKTVFSDAIANQISRSASACQESSPVKSEIGGNGLGDGNSSSSWQELQLEPCGGKNEGTNFTGINNTEGHSNGTIGSASERSLVARNSKRSSVSSGIAVMARTAMPVTKGLSLDLRWGLNFPGNMGLKMPSLTVNKIGLEWVTEAKENRRSTDASGDDSLLLKGAYFSMQRDLESVEKENREMKQILDEMKKGVSARNHREEGNNGIGKKVSQRSDESSSEFERWRSKKNAKEEKGQKEPTKSHSLSSDLESELQKAIKIASS